MKIGLDAKSACIISSLQSKLHHANLALIRHFSNGDGGPRRPVLFFHGATVSTLMTSAYRIDGLSWFDALAEEGRPIYGLDLLGYGESDPYPEVDVNERVDPRDFGAGIDLIREIDTAVDAITAENETDKVHIIAISRGAIPAGYYAAAHLEKVQSITFHGPITRRSGLGTAVIEKYFGRRSLPPIGHFSVSARDRFNLLRDDRPAGTESPLEDSFVRNWMHDYSERVHGDRDKIDEPIRAPMGFAVDISNAWDDIYFDEAKLVMPTFIIRGEWDQYLTPAASCQSFFEKVGSHKKVYLQLAEGTHSMMYERCRHSLHRHTKLFLSEND
ncbi:alpha/beta hydrolase [Bradyrhizobium sp. SZCCHNRI1003]|uniref:alpha/beta hydrolase n=1 Tax=Bradyrhizobium sp. SZCCHNRI1003 TaxID=3057275 RepID=UPI002916B5B8|nr:alpha/beta hydrolase [Bradyrhizobium sp. SZCCHNRI1003]